MRLFLPFFLLGCRSDTTQQEIKEQVITNDADGDGYLQGEDCDDLEFACFELSETSCTVSHESNEEFTFFYQADIAKNIGLNEDLFDDGQNPLDYISEDTDLSQQLYNYYADLDGERGLLDYFLPHVDFETVINPLVSYRSYLLHHNIGEYRSLELDAILNIKELSSF